MKTLRDHEELIRAKVEEINKADKNWTFTVKSFAKDRVRIRWSYLDYLQEKDNCFTLQLEASKSEPQDYFITSRSPEGLVIVDYAIGDTEVLKYYQDSFENAIIWSIKRIADYAHSRY